MIRKLTILVFAVFLLATPVFATAQSNPCTRAGIAPGDKSLSTLPKCINQIYVWSLGLAALLALFMTVSGGYLYMTASGNAEQTSKAKEYIWGSVIGLALLFTAYILLRTINLDLINFSNESFNQIEETTPTTTTPQPPGPRQPAGGGE